MVKHDSMPIAMSGDVHERRNRFSLDYVFLSYVGEEQSDALMFHQALEDSGMAVWWDQDIMAGEAWEEALVDKLVHASCVVVIWNHFAAASEWVRFEANVARALGTLILLRRDDTPLPKPLDTLLPQEVEAWDGDNFHRCVVRPIRRKLRSCWIHRLVRAGLAGGLCAAVVMLLLWLHHPPPARLASRLPAITVNLSAPKPGPTAPLPSSTPDLPHHSPPPRPGPSPRPTPVPTSTVSPAEPTATTNPSSDNSSGRFREHRTPPPSDR